MTRLVAALTLVITAGGCTSAQVMRTDVLVRPRTSPDSVIFLTAVPEKPFTVIAVIKVSDDGNGTDTSKRLRQEAAKIGGHAILIVDATQSTLTAASGVGGAFGAVVVPIKEQTAQIIVFTAAPR